MRCFLLTRARWNGRLTLIVAGLAALAIVLATAPAAIAQTAPLAQRDVPVHFDSGVHINNGDQPEVVWATVIEVSDAAWLRVNFELAELGQDPQTLESSLVRVTSLDDLAAQHLNAVGMSQWYNTSAYLNGSAVYVELVAAPNGLPTRIVIDKVIAGEPEPGGGIDSICGPTDDRLPSFSPRNARLMSIGCTAWIIDDPNHQFITAGHCIGGSTVEFNVPMSNSNGTINHPGPEDQYSVQTTSRQSVNGGIGNDWGYFACFPNTETGLTAYQAQGDFYTLAATPPPVQGQTIRITGYGVTGSGVPREWNQIQKTHTGSYFSFSGSTVRYVVDTSGGNSGSPVLLEDTGEAIGVHTHAGCTAGGGANHGTGINNSGWQNALANPRQLCDFSDLQLPTLTAGQNATVTIVDDQGAGEKAFVIYSFAGTGELLLPAMGVTLGLKNPILAGSTTFDNAGVAKFTRMIPGSAKGKTVWVQALRAGRVSDVESAKVN